MRHDGYCDGWSPPPRSQYPVPSGLAAVPDQTPGYWAVVVRDTGVAIMTALSSKRVAEDHIAAWERSPWEMPHA